jgi:hypothetical protein
VGICWKAAYWLIPLGYNSEDWHRAAEISRPLFATERASIVSTALSRDAWISPPEQ